MINISRMSVYIVEVHSKNPSISTTSCRSFSIVMHIEKEQKLEIESDNCSKISTTSICSCLTCIFK